MVRLGWIVAGGRISYDTRVLMFSSYSEMMSFFEYNEGTIANMDYAFRRMEESPGVDAGT